MKTKYLAYSDSRDVDAEGFSFIGKDFYTNKGITASGNVAFGIPNLGVYEVSVAFRSSNKEYFGIFHVIRVGTLSQLTITKISEMIFGGTSLTISNSGSNIILTSNSGDDISWKIRDITAR